GYTYEWRRGGETAVLQSTKTASNIPAGDYEVTITDKNGCSITKQVSIIDAIEAFISSRSVCEDDGNEDAIRTSYFQVEDLSAHGGVGPYTYSWDFGSGATNQIRSGVGEHTVYYSAIGNKTISLTVTDSQGKSFTATQVLYVGKCYEPCGKSENFSFNPDNIYIGDSNGNPVNTKDVIDCNTTINKYIFIKVDKSANAYNPYIELVYTISNSLTSTTNTYYENDCKSGPDIDDDPNDNKDNLVGDYIKLTSNPINFVCGDNLNVESFYITWTNVSKKKCGQNNNAFCYSTNEPVVVPTPLKAEATSTPLSCKGSSSGSISVKASGGYAPYGFNLTGTNDSYGNSSNFNNLDAGDYTIYVKDSRGNTTTTQVTVTEPSSSVTATTSVENPTCFGDLGSATVTGEGGTPFTTGEPYHYLWNDATEQTTATATGLTPGDYTVTVIDANGCQTIGSVTIAQPVELTQAQAGEDQIFNCGTNSTRLEANVPETGNGQWSITSGSGATIEDPSDPTSAFSGPAGTYVLRWTISNDDNTCSNYDEVSITFKDDCSTLDFDGIDDYILFTDDYGLSSGKFSIEAWVKPNSITGTQTV
ncbi:MAG: hypothetical protein WCD31_06565, partial [Gillisia sp.]